MRVSLLTHCDALCNLIVCILECVERGVDMFDGAYPFILAEHAFASVFPLDMGDGNCEMKMNLRDAKYAKDKSPIVEQCKCYCCTTYSRAYIHHLFDAHEMLGEICLTMFVNSCTRVVFLHF